jgi:lipoprotein-releasing system permease protein
MFSISWKYLWTRKKQTILIFLGVVLGTGAYVTISGMMLGFQNYIKEKLIDNEPHITITKKDKPISAEKIALSHYGSDVVFWSTKPGGYRSSSTIENPLLWYKFLNSQDNVIAWSSNLTIDALVRRSAFELPVRLIGTRPRDQINVTNMEQYMVKGSFLDISESGKKIILGKTLLEKIGAEIGDTVDIVLASGQKDSFKVAGIYNLGIKTIDETTIFAGLLDVQSLKNAPGAISQISVKLSANDVSNAREIAFDWRDLSEEKVSSWEENNESILSVFNTQNIVRNFMTISILIVASFGIYNILSILISQKRKDIAIFRAIGFYPEDIVKIFLWQGLVIGIIGGLLGLVIGYFVCLYLSTIEVDSGRMTGSGSTMLVAFDFVIYLKAFFLAFFSCLISAYLPSSAAGKLEPMEIFRES